MEAIQKRLEDTYNRLVDNTENPTVLEHLVHRKQLSFSLQLIEYITGNTDDNPIDDYFIDPY